MLNLAMMMMMRKRKRRKRKGRKRRGKRRQITTKFSEFGRQCRTLLIFALSTSVRI